ncbi:MAG TPA: flagellar hook-associated protein FlgK [Polyangiales bacterium]|nr:flagellar hook-associated protein FlgK [Polyangiales bacterium]
MNLSGILTAGANGLAAASHGTQVTSQNISNATTEGYTRRVAQFEPIPLDQGGGVRSRGSVRIQDAYLERRGLGARAANGEAAAKQETLSVFDSIFNEEQGSLGGALDAFDSALSDFAANPSSRANRQAILSKAEDLSRAFNATSNALTTARTDANARIADSVKQVNTKLDQIGELSTQIVAAYVNGNEAGDLEDRRDQLIREVGEYIPVQVIPDKQGAITLQMAGQRTLVGPDSSVHHLLAIPEATSGDIRIYRDTAGQNEDITAMISSGKIGGTFAARDGALATAKQQLDQLASDVATAYNAQHVLGYGADGVNGRNLFAPPASVAGAAASFAVSGDVAGQPDLIAGAQDPLNLPSDNRNAIAMLHVRDQLVALGGTATAQQAFTALVADAGTAAQQANHQATQANAVLEQIDNLRASASGVSTDEEMIALMKFQRAYQASLRVIETADSMLNDLLSLRR